nr:hypothetical protein Iba_chr08aCG1430 [Ipomoea batatas]GME04098.1 hypothetical protein Iba_scaffold1536CG0570 [Ipomoea batatas]
MPPTRQCSKMQALEMMAAREVHAAQGHQLHGHPHLDQIQSYLQTHKLLLSAPLPLHQQIVAISLQL